MATPSKTPPGADPKQLERTGTVREIGSQAVWSLSSCKPGNYSLRHPPPAYSLLCEQMTVNIFQKWTQSQKLCYFSPWSCSYAYPHFHSVVSSLPYCTIATFGSISEAVGINSSLMCLPSTCPGFGVDQLRDDNLETYWQSDGSQPHLVNIQFR